MAERRREDRLMKIPALLHLSRLGYAFLPRKELNRDPGTNFLPQTLRESMERIAGKAFSAEQFDALMTDLRAQLSADDLGLAFYRTLRDGWRGWELIDFEHPDRNTFQASSEIPCGGKGGSFRPDITLFVNGLPLAMIEVKTRDQHRGVRAEYDRMLKRFKNEAFRPYLQAAQILAISNGQARDPDRFLPTEGACYATIARRDFVLHEIPDRFPGSRQELLPLDPTAAERIWADGQITESPVGREERRSRSPGTPTHRMLTGLFYPQRFLFLLRYGIQYWTEGEIVLQKRVLNPEQWMLLLAVQKKLERKYLNWKLEMGGAAGRQALTASLVSLLRDGVPGCRIYQVLRARTELLRTDAALHPWGIKPARRSRPDDGDLVLMEPSTDAAAWMRERTEVRFKGQRIFLLPPEEEDDELMHAFDGALRRADPRAILIRGCRGLIPEASNFVYLMRCADHTLYCGWTNDLSRRLAAHNAGKGAKYTRSRLPVQLVYYEAFDTPEEAMSREWHLKRLTKAEKEQLIAKARKVSEPTDAPVGAFPKERKAIESTEASQRSAPRAAGDD